MDDRLTEAARDEAERARLERDAAINAAIDISIDRDAAEQAAVTEAARRASLQRENSHLRADANASKLWGARNAAGLAEATRTAGKYADDARSTAAGFLVLLAIVIVAAISLTIWYVNQPSQQTTIPIPTENRTIVVNPTSPTPPANTEALPATSPQPSVTINNQAPSTPAPAVPPVSPPNMSSPANDSTSGQQSSPSANSTNGTSQTPGANQGTTSTTTTAPSSDTTSPATSSP